MLAEGFELALIDHRDAAGVDEGMDGVSTRFAFKILAATFNHDTAEVVADRSLPLEAANQALRTVREEGLNGAAVISV